VAIQKRRENYEKSDYQQHDDSNDLLCPHELQPQAALSQMNSI
jgi:hypothetical protein